ncbi:NFU domain protein 4 isoform 1 [Hibiscus syriacus]|uniref:Receptor-like serine/threonine-protein kinase n=1 Tax=Hibiscus syriacus TaxID=106335 RepID=A0A6A3ATA7_HIBSY|nr:putative receptor protein kinase ZmPK1 [Hibiscus syriacus]KAE8707921.1 NFU domain protein 4 isoform 1 [Hibiscus syriacus]
MEAKCFKSMALVFFLFIGLASSDVPYLRQGSSLSVENPDDVLVSANGMFSAGFSPVGQNAYCFVIWFSKPCRDGSRTFVWTANRDTPVNGKRSKLSLLKTNKIILTDADEDPTIIWMSNNTVKMKDSWSQLKLLDSGNLVLQTRTNLTLWQSFDSPTDTLLPGQPLTRHKQLVSARSRTDYSSGKYKLLFDNDNVLRLVLDNPETSSIYWPDSTMLDYHQGRTRYNDSKIAVLDSSGYFLSSDNTEFRSADFGFGPLRRLTLDFDGNLRLYSLEEQQGVWFVTWQAMSNSCRIHGACGPNSICSYDPGSGPKCGCPPGFKMKNQRDWNDGCEPEFELSCNNHDFNFVELRHVNFFGYHHDILRNYTFQECVKDCLVSCCKAFQYRYFPEDGRYRCYSKWELRNGHRYNSYVGTLYLKLPKSFPYDKPVEDLKLNCSNMQTKQLETSYVKKTGHGSLNVIIWCASIIGLLEMICVSLVFFFLYKTGKSPDALSTMATSRYLVAPTGFKRFTYGELKRATRGFREEIGRGGGGVVYKGVLPDQRIAAIKRLNAEAHQGEDEFLAEVSTIGRLNHMNLIEMWGYCAEGKHRLLVYEYMENGSLADNLVNNSLDWKKIFEIAVGTAKGLAYLHEECLEWVLHCDVKPHNILLDSAYHPKVSDFGLSKLLARDSPRESSFSKIRGTRGYMAPEWVYNLPITAKVDIYSYGIVLLEMITGKKPGVGVPVVGTNGEKWRQRLETWVKGKKIGASGTTCWVEEVLDPAIGDDCDRNELDKVIEVAIKCTEADRHHRPSMSQVVQMLAGDQINAHCLPSFQ